VKPEEIFTPESLAHFRSARTAPPVPLPSPTLWLRLSGALCVAAVCGAVAYAFLGRATRYQTVAGTISQIADGEVELRERAEATVGLASGQRGRWMAASEQGAPQALTVVQLIPAGPGQQGGILRLRPDDLGRCLREGPCAEGARVQVEIETGWQPLIDLLRARD
jgi:hypothetical protein